LIHGFRFGKNPTQSKQQTGKYDAATLPPDQQIHDLFPKSNFSKFHQLLPTIKPPKVQTRITKTK
jgi:hypothetical protein